MEQHSLQKLLVAFALLLVFVAIPAESVAQSSCSQFGVIPLANGAYNFQMNEFNSSQTECATINGVGFTINTANFNNATNGAPGAYTSIYRGCHWGTCTSSNPFPIQESNIASATSSVSFTQPSGYNNDSAYDIWFNQTATTSGQPNGTEVMIWLNHQGGVQPFGSQTSTATINGTDYAVWTGNQSSWKIVSYVATTPVTSVTNLNLLPFFEDAVSRGSLDPSWWLIDIEFGFEIWTGGQGLAVSNFSASAAAGATGGGSCATVPSAPSGLTASASSTSAINLSWTADTAPANCAIAGYNVYRSTTSNFTPTSGNLIAHGVNATSYSDNGLSPSTTYYYKIEAVDAAGVSAPSAPASATTQVVSGGGGSGCHVGYSIVNSWPGGFQAAITIQNTSSTAWSSWSMTWNFANDQTINGLWNGAATQSGGNVTVRNYGYNGTIPAGGSYNGVGFTGTWNNATNAVPTSFAINGTACQ
jgi:hypothetical protein